MKFQWEWKIGRYFSLCIIWITDFYDILVKKWQHELLRFLLLICLFLSHLLTFSPSYFIYSSFIFSPDFSSSFIFFSCISSSFISSLTSSLLHCHQPDFVQFVFYKFAFQTAVRVGIIIIIVVFVVVVVIFIGDGDDALPQSPSFSAWTPSHISRLRDDKRGRKTLEPSSQGQLKVQQHCKAGCLATSAADFTPNTGTNTTKLHFIKGSISVKICKILRWYFLTPAEALWGVVAHW